MMYWKPNVILPGFIVTIDDDNEWRDDENWVQEWTHFEWLQKETDLIKYSWEMHRCNVLEYGFFFTFSSYSDTRLSLSQSVQLKARKPIEQKNKISNNTDVLSKDIENYFCCFF